TLPNTFSVASVPLLSKVKTTGETTPPGNKSEHDLPFEVAVEQSCGSVRSPGPSPSNMKLSGVPANVMNMLIEGGTAPMLAIVPVSPTGRGVAPSYVRLDDATLRFGVGPNTRLVRLTVTVVPLPSVAKFPITVACAVHAANKMVIPKRARAIDLRPEFIVF